MQSPSNSACTRHAGAHAVTDDDIRARRLEAYSDVLRKGLASDQVFAQTMFKLMPSANRLFTFKKQLCAQIALASLFGHLVNSPPALLNKLLFAKASGRVFIQDTAVRYSSGGSGGAGERDPTALRPADLPYRFTRNLHSFVTPFGVEGWLLVAQVLCAQAMLVPKHEIPSAIALFFRCGEAIVVFPPSQNMPL